MVGPIHAVGKTALYQISQCGLMISSFLLACLHVSSKLQRYVVYQQWITLWLQLISLFNEGQFVENDSWNSTLSTWTSWRVMTSPWTTIILLITKFVVNSNLFCIVGMTITISLSFLGRKANNILAMRRHCRWLCLGKMSDIMGGEGGVPS